MDPEQLVGEARERERTPMRPRERLVATATAIAFMVAASVIATQVPFNRTLDLPVISLLVGLAVIARRVRFEIGTAEACADQLVFIPILFLAPLPLVPLLTALAYVGARTIDITRVGVHPDRWLYSVGDAWHSVGAVVVVVALAPGTLAMDHVGVYGLMLIAQMLAGLALVIANDYLVHGNGPQSTVRSALEACRIDAMLAPVAFTVAAVAESQPMVVVALVPLMWLLAAFSRERRERYGAALELNQAYRGTVMVLADVVEADDAYTASHCRSVVDLCAAVAAELGLTEPARQELEMAALLHDVGKIAIPAEILNKPAKLTDAEFELMKTHTTEGQALLDRVGGKLAQVGQVVRSCHERWDGAGYPDGLRGDQIPESARIVFCCDAYSAMTTDRPYRKAMSQELALTELRESAGTQFEPRVVAALERVAMSAGEETRVPSPDAVGALPGARRRPALSRVKLSA